jgi:hypothetical protein
MMCKEFPDAPVATDYELGYSLGQVWWYLGERAFTYRAHERMAFLGLDGESFVELGKGYRDGFFRQADWKDREKYQSAEGSALRRLIRKQAYARYPASHVGLPEFPGRVAVFSPSAFVADGR